MRGPTATGCTQEQSEQDQQQILILPSPTAQTLAFAKAAFMFQAMLYNGHNIHCDRGANLAYIDQVSKSASREAFKACSAMLMHLAMVRDA